MLEKIDASKATGIRNVPNFIAIIFNKSIEQGVFPKDFKIFKSYTDFEIR